MFHFIYIFFPLAGKRCLPFCSSHPKHLSDVWASAPDSYRTYILVHGLHQDRCYLRLVKALAIDIPKSHRDTEISSVDMQQVKSCYCVCVIPEVRWVGKGYTGAIAGVFKSNLTCVPSLRHKSSNGLMVNALH